MKLLLDEQIPKRLAAAFPPDYTILTAQEMNWSSKRNGELISLASDNGFDALITADKNMEYQQNSESLPIAVIVMAPLFNRLSDLTPLVPKVVSLLEKNKDNRKFFRVDA